MKKTVLCFLLLLACASPVWAASYVDNGNSTISDQVTGLVWQQNADGTLRSWQQGLDYCNNLTLGGSNNWRLPNIKELRSIVDETRYNPAIDPIFNGAADNYWSSSSYADVPGNAWYVYFYNGNVENNSKGFTVFIRCVR